MKIITVAAPKGGVGKTTTAVNLAVHLAARRPGVRFLDLDPQASATLALGAEPLRDLLRSEPAPIPDRNLTLFPGGRLLDRASRGEIGSIVRRAAHGALLLIIDTPPSMTEITLAALRVGTIVITPIEPVPLALPALEELSRTLHGMGSGKRMRVLLSRARPVRRITREVVETITQRFPNALYPIAIPDDVRAAESLPLRDSTCRAAGAFRDLTDWVEADLW